MARYFALMIALMLAIVPSISHSQEYFGKFLDNLDGKFLPERKPRPSFVLANDFRFDDPNGLQWVTPAKTEVDGASIPQAFWSFIGGPFEGEYISASVIHDYYCDVKTRTAHDTHRNFYYGMRASGVALWKAEFMYWAVSTFGPDWKLQPRVTLLQACLPASDGTVTCTTTPKIENMLVTLPAADLSDPEVLKLALSKATAIAKTLRTTDGKVLDLSPEGKPVLATVENVQSSSAAYRTLFASKDFYTSSFKLGLMAHVDSSSDLAAVQPWSGNQIPKLSDTWVLTPHTAPLLNPEKPFKVDARSKGLVIDKINLETLGQSRVISLPR